jgi:hypothetical protein
MVFEHATLTVYGMGFIADGVEDFEAEYHLIYLFFISHEQLYLHMDTEYNNSAAAFYFFPSH